MILRRIAFQHDERATARPSGTFIGRAGGGRVTVQRAVIVPLGYPIKEPGRGVAREPFLQRPFDGGATNSRYHGACLADVYRGEMANGERCVRESYGQRCGNPLMHCRSVHRGHLELGPHSPQCSVTIEHASNSAERPSGGSAENVWCHVDVRSMLRDVFNQVYNTTRRCAHAPT